MKHWEVIFSRGGEGETCKLAWVKWEQVLSSHEKVDIGLGTLKAFNNALLQKWHWRFMVDDDTKWARMLKSIHGEDGVRYGQ